MSFQITKDTKLCMSLASKPGTFGIRFHNFLYRELNLDFIYKSFTTDSLEDAIRGVRALGIRGCAISMPFKEKVIPLLDELDPPVHRIGAVNTIVNEQGRLKGYNTDYIAVRELILKNEISNQWSVALLGSGGMARAMASSLHDLGFKNCVIFSRNLQTGPRLAEQYGFEWSEKLFAKKFELLLNATPIGMTSHISGEQPFPLEMISESHFVLDSVAQPSITELIHKAQSLNKKTIPGHQISVIQASEQFRLYTGVTPSQEAIHRAEYYALSL